MNNQSSSWNYRTGKFIDSSTTIQERLQATKLDWELLSSPMHYGEFGEYESDKRAVYRSDNKALIDIYSSRTPRSNGEIVSFMDKLLNLADLSMNELGSYGDGAFIYCSASLSSEYDVNVRKVGDITKPRIVICDSHLVNEGMKIYVHFDRLVCTNGMSRKVSQKVGVINHVGGINAKVARDVLTEALKIVNVKKEVSEFLADTQMTLKDAQVQLITAFGDPEKPISEQPSMVKTCLELFNGKGQGSEMLSAYGTAFGLLQSVTEFYSHLSPAKTEQSRFASVLSGDYAKNSSNFEKQLVRAYR
jgi:hypothetical protein